PEYYLTGCEYEILSLQSGSVADTFMDHLKQFDLVELGAGDCFKSKFLLKELCRRSLDFTFFAVDISENSVEQLNLNLPREVPGLKLRGLNGEYLPMLKKAQELSRTPKAVLFLGSNIGNMEKGATLSFLEELRSLLHPGDLVLIGFDLKKDPHMILAAYNDKRGITRSFNLNLLERINRELQADFDTDEFTHFPVYDPLTGTCRSYLVSLSEQRVNLGVPGETVYFQENEPVCTEISQKYGREEIAALAGQAGFEPIAALYDRKRWFTDVVWKCI
ncbi:MAG TPA: L-histidine N(alpha)-methyltransferase, partial [Anseongella sp.]|nr:L-histidine N(alpha)-methyltransferase [Anseongella sp.]